jgi:Domain of unknown function (DUF4350)
MKLFAQLDAKDRRLLLICLGAVVVLAVVTALFARNQNRDDNPVPSSYLTGRHGARAAYELLEENGYKVERWEQPLGELGREANTGTVVILAEPFLTSVEDFKAVDAIVKHGGRVLVTGMSGGALAPEEAVGPPMQLDMAACALEPEGLDTLAGSGTVWMSPAASWRLVSPRYRVEYTCGGSPAVVEYDAGAGHVVWWASSTPLENGSIGRGENMHLFLNSLGAQAGHRFYWDESLHGEVQSEWFYARGAALNLLLWGVCGLALLVIFSFSRRSGPLRAAPAAPRTTPVEFVEALGSLYAKAGASATAVRLAYDQFRSRIGALCGLRGLQMSADEMGAALRRRFPQANEELERELKAGEEGAENENLTPKQALKMVQALSRELEALEETARRGRDANVRR